MSDPSSWHATAVNLAALMAFSGVAYALGARRARRRSERAAADLAGANVRLTGDGVRLSGGNANLAGAVLESSSLLRTVLDSTAEISIIATDPELTIRVFNAGAERLLGYRSDEVVGLATPILVHDAGEVRVCGEELGLMLGRPVEGLAVFTATPMLMQSREWTYIRKDGGRIKVSMVVTPMFSDAGELVGYVWVAHDVTRQHHYEESLRAATGKSDQANRAKSEFLANMSHEIRTPLNAIIGLGYLLDQTSLSADQRQFLSKIQFAGRALLGVINNVLDLSKVEAGEMTLESEQFDLRELVRELGQMLTPQAVAKGIKLSTQTAPDLPATLRGDAVRLRQVLINLVNNALKFTEAGSVALNVFCTEQSAELVRLRCEVTDTGIGIEAASLERLFTPFAQADSSTTRRFGGTGLGLSIARRLVRLMAGEIGVTSAVAVGSTFWIEIPLRITVQRDSSVGREQEYGLRVCVADANGDAPDGVGAMVRALGWNSHTVDSAERLIDVIATTGADEYPDVLVVDLHLEDDATYQLIARLETECVRDELPPVIVLVDLPQSHTAYFKFMRASDVVLVRPVSSAALFNAVNSVVWSRYDGCERALQFANFDQMNTQWLSGVHVLVADDSDINLEVAQRILEIQGATVLTCSDGRAALEAVRAHAKTLDIVLMDVQMPILDGNEAARRIRGELQLPDLPIMALTAGALVGERVRSLEAGMNDFISKPFDPAALISKVRRVVEQARGAPIPMVSHVTRPADDALDIAQMSCFDAGMVRRTFGDDLSLFRLLLPRMLAEFDEFAAPSVVSLEDEAARNRLRGRTHKLKGSSGMLGAMHVMRLAGAAEDALAQGCAAAVVEPILAHLASALATLREESRALLETAARRAAVPADAAHAPLSKTDIVEIHALLEAQNLAAVESFEKLSASLRAFLQPEQFERLKAAVDNLDFCVGARLLRTAAAHSLGEFAALRDVEFSSAMEQD